MSELRPSFAILEDASGTGVAAREVQLGDSPTAKSGLLGFSFRDSAGNATMPTLTADNRLPVTFDSAGNALRSRGEVAAGSPSGTFVTVTQITLTPGSTYTNVFGKVSCRQPALFQMLTVVDSVETILEDSVLDAGVYNDDLGNNPLEFSVASGASSAVLRIRAYNFGSGPAKQSPLRASLNCVEVVS
jgi:hypothetical protein